MKNFTKDSITQAILNIDTNPALLKGRESIDYDILHTNGKRYPPILVLSEANKVLGGEKLVIHDFKNNTKIPFKILNDLGYEIVSKVKNTTLMDADFNIKGFLDACKQSNLIISEELASRFIASLITKPFVILTGLSGSGKTKIALAFAKWISNKGLRSYKSRFRLGEEVSSNRVTYKVTATDTIAVTFTQSETGIKATFPYELIDEWIKVINEMSFTSETPIRDIRNAVQKITKYSTQLNSFESHLKAAAFHLISKEEIQLEDESSFCLLPVGADWTNREPLLGYPNALIPETYVVPENGALQLIIRAIENPDNPYFLILDEMNLSHVERYFADFLSGMESKEPIFLHSGTTNHNGIPPTIQLPENVFIIGTVNIDETTYMFSPKVLDRANVIEFRVDEKQMEVFLNGNINVNLEELAGKGVNMAYDFLLKSRTKFKSSKSKKETVNDLLNFFDKLSVVGAEFGYRTASEIIRFISVCQELKTKLSYEDILDAAIMQKLLPKLHGSRRKLNLILKPLALLCLNDKTLVDDILNPKKNIEFKNNKAIKFPVSLEKLRRMNNGLIHNNFASYAEA